MNSNIKGQQIDDSKNEYANQLQKTNELQNQFYTQLMPAVFQFLQDMDEKRMKCIQNFMRKSAQIEQDILPIISKCLEGILRCTDAMNEKGFASVDRSVQEWVSATGDILGTITAERSRRGWDFLASLAKIRIFPVSHPRRISQSFHPIKKKIQSKISQGTAVRDGPIKMKYWKRRGKWTS